MRTCFHPAKIRVCRLVRALVQSRKQLNVDEMSCWRVWLDRLNKGDPHLDPSVDELGFIEELVEIPAREGFKHIVVDPFALDHGCLHGLGPVRDLRTVRIRLVALEVHEDEGEGINFAGVLWEWTRRLFDCRSQCRDELLHQ